MYAETKHFLVVRAKRNGGSEGEDNCDENEDGFDHKSSKYEEEQVKTVVWVFGIRVVGKGCELDSSRILSKDLTYIRV